MIILIDDDELIQTSWILAANKNSKNLKCFFSIDEFLENAELYSKDVVIFIDSNLANGKRGEIESEKLYQNGFKNLYLATGYNAEDIKKPEWIKKVFGKKFPSEFLK